MKPVFYPRVLSTAVFLLAIIPQTFGIALPQHLEKRRNERVYQMVLKADFNQSDCQATFTDEYIWQSKILSLSVADRVKSALKDIRDKCDYVQIDESYAAYSAEKESGRYQTFSQFENWRDFKGEYFGAGDKRKLSYIELICNESGGSPLVNDIEKLNSNIGSNPSCDTHLRLYDKDPKKDKCIPTNTFGTATSSLCRPGARLNEKFDDYPKGFVDPDRKLEDKGVEDKEKTLYQMAEEMFKSVHSTTDCWIRQHVLPQLVLEKCKNSLGKPGGIVRFGVVINEDRFRCWRGFSDVCNDNRTNWKIIWVMDATVHHS